MRAERIDPKLFDSPAPRRVVIRLAKRNRIYLYEIYYFICSKHNFVTDAHSISQKFFNLYTDLWTIFQMTQIVKFEQKQSPRSIYTNQYIHRRKKHIHITHGWKWKLFNILGFIASDIIIWTRAECHYVTSLLLSICQCICNQLSFFHTSTLCTHAHITRENIQILWMSSLNCFCTTPRRTHNCT